MGVVYIEEVLRFLNRPRTSRDFLQRWPSPKEFDEIMARVRQYNDTWPSRPVLRAAGNDDGRCVVVYWRKPKRYGKLWKRRLDALNVLPEDGELV